MRCSIALATLAALTSLAALPALAQNGTPAKIPVPGPSGTPVTFGTPAQIGAPVPVTPAKPDDVNVPTTDPAPKHPPKSYVNRHEVFVVGDYLVAPKVYNEFSQGLRTGMTSYAIKGAAEFNIGDLPVMIEGESRDQAYLHGSDSNNVVSCNSTAGIGNVGCVKRIGSGNSAGYVAPRLNHDYDLDGRLGVKLLDPRVYLAVAYLWKTNDYGYGYSSGPGLGLEKLPDFEGPVAVYFGLYYFPNVTGRYTGLKNATSEGLKYRIFRYEGGFVVTPGHNSPVFFDLGVEGDRENARAGSPSSETHIEPYAGIGLRPPNY